MPVNLLQALRTASLRRWMLACVLLAWGAAWATPLLQPGGLQVVCSASGHLKLVGAKAAGHGASHIGDCTQCAPSSLMSTPLPRLPDLMLAAAAGAAADRSPSPESARTGALPPARGPPIPPSHPERSDHV